VINALIDAAEIRLFIYEARVVTSVVLDGAIWVIARHSAWRLISLFMRMLRSCVGLCLWFDKLSSRC